MCVGTRRIGSACLLLLLLAGAGCGDLKNRKAALSEQEIERLTYARKPARPDELIVSGEAVTCDDITNLTSEPNMAGSLRDRLMMVARQMTLEEFLEAARPQMRPRLNSNIANVILYRRAWKEIGDKADEKLDEMAEKELRRFIVEHGGNVAAADAALQRRGMNRARFKEYVKKQMLTRYYVTSKFLGNRPITHRELLEAYDKMKAEHFYQAGLVQFSLIDIQITKVRLAEGQDDPIQAARDLAGRLMERIKAGEDFAALAREYSHDYRSQAGGLWPARDPDALAAPYDALGRKTREMQPGEVAGPIETLDHIFIMKLEQKQEKGYRPLEEVQDVLTEQILADRRNEATDRLDAEVAQQIADVDTDRFIDYCLTSLHRQANATPPGQ